MFLITSSAVKPRYAALVRSTSMWIAGIVELLLDDRVGDPATPLTLARMSSRDLLALLELGRDHAQVHRAQRAVVERRGHRVDHRKGEVRLGIEPR